MNDTLIKVEGVSKRFCRSLKKSLWYGMQDLGNEIMGRRHGGSGQLRANEFWALKDVNLELKRGECLGLIGRNGAGKTTLLRLLNGLIKPDQGRIEVRGRVGALIALGAGFNPILTGRENIHVNASILGLSMFEIEEKIDEIIDFAELGDFIDTPVQSYSSGMQLRLGFAAATALEPDILLLDEVLAVGDAAFRGKCFNRMHKLMQNCAVVFVSHSMAQVGRVATSVAHVDGGQVTLFNGNPTAGIAVYSSKHEPLMDQCNVQSDILAIEAINVSERSTSDDSNPSRPDIQHIDISFTIRSKRRTEQNVSLLIVLTDSEMQNIAEIRRPVEGANLAAQNTFEQVVTLNKCQLGSGKYYVSCALLVGEGGEVGANCQFGAFIVIDSGWAGYAPVRL